MDIGMKIKILFVWSEKEIEIFRRICIERAHEVYPDVEIYCIAKYKDWMPDWLKIIPWEEAERRSKTSFENPITASDHFRFYYASVWENLLYLDTDVYCLEPMPEIEKGKIGLRPFDICMIFSNDCQTLIKEFYNQTRYRHILLKVAGRFFREFVDIEKYFIHAGKALGKNIKQTLQERIDILQKTQTLKGESHEKEIQTEIVKS